MSSTDLERNFSSLVLAAGDSNSLEGDLGTKANLSAAKQPSPARNSAEILTVETSDGELVDFERSIAIKMSPVLREKLGKLPIPFFIISPEASNFVHACGRSESVGPSGVIQLDNITTRAICKAGSGLLSLIQPLIQSFPANAGDGVLSRAHRSSSLPDGEMDGPESLG